MKIDDFIYKYYELPQEKGYGAGEVPEFSIERVRQMLKDLLVLAADKADVETERAIDENWYIVDKESILNILE